MILSRKRYDKEDRVILYAKDFQDKEGESFCFIDVKAFMKQELFYLQKDP